VIWLPDDCWLWSTEGALNSDAGSLTAILGCDKGSGCVWTAIMGYPILIKPGFGVILIA